MLIAYGVVKVSYVPEYTASATMYVRAIGDASQSNHTQTIYLSASNLAVAYSEVISDNITQERLSELSSGEFNAKISA